MLQMLNNTISKHFSTYIDIVDNISEFYDTIIHDYC